MTIRKGSSIIAGCLNNDLEVVHKTGNETINDIKLFTDDIRCTKPNLIKGNNPTENLYYGFIYDDGTPYPSGQRYNDKNRFGLYETEVKPNGDVSTYIYAYKNIANEDTHSKISITYPLSGNPYTYAPTPTDTTTTSGNQIATTGWVNSIGNNILHLTGNETIDGQKTFTADVNFSGGGILSRIVQQSDGNFVIYKDNTAILATGRGNTSKYLEAPNNGGADQNGTVIITNGISKNLNGYVKLGNGIIIQWGLDNNTTNGRTITFSTPFTSAYGLSVVKAGQSGASGDYCCAVGGESLTDFKVYINTSIRWIAVGY